MATVLTWVVLVLSNGQYYNVEHKYEFTTPGECEQVKRIILMDYPTADIKCETPA